jgi:hypothetical protein
MTLSEFHEFIDLMLAVLDRPGYERVQMPTISWSGVSRSAYNASCRDPETGEKPTSYEPRTRGNELMRCGRGAGRESA